MRQFSRMRMYTGWLADAYRPLFDDTPICHWGYMYYDLAGRYLQLISDQSLLDDFFHHESYTEQILGDLEIIESSSYSSHILDDISLYDKHKYILTNRGYSYFFDFIKRNNDSEHSFSTEVVTIGSFIDPVKANNFVLNNIDILNRVCEDIAKRCRRHVTKENILILPKDFMINVNEIFENKKHEPIINLQDRILNLSNRTQQFSEYFDKTFDFSQLPFSFLACRELTQKEKEIIYLYYYSFGSGRIASILDISRRTVEKNFENIRKKLKCESSSQIIPTLLRFDHLIKRSLSNQIL